MVILASAFTHHHHRKNPEEERGSVFEHDDYVEASRFGKVLFSMVHWEVLLHPWQQLIVLYFFLSIMSVIGGILFWQLEFDQEAEFLKTRLEFKDELYNRYNTTQIEVMERWASIGTEFGESDPPVNKWEWRYASFFASTTFTTVGFGFQAPVTRLGQFATFVWGLPAIMCYFCLAQQIGILTLAIFEYILRNTCVNPEQYLRYHIRFQATTIIIFFLLISWVITVTSTNDGFGHGIDDNYFNSLYFLFQTSFTIGFGDVMMSGSSMGISCMIGIWLATILGVLMQFLEQLGSLVELDPKGIQQARAMKQEWHNFKATLDDEEENLNLNEVHISKVKFEEITTTENKDGDFLNKKNENKSKYEIQV